MPAQKQSLGRWGEERAAEFLIAKGYEVLGRNIRTAYGEIDLLSRQGATLIFVEVKARSSEAYGHPEESISAVKRQHMAEAAESYLQAHPEFEGDWRVDVIAISRRGGSPQILHIEDALAE